MAYYGDQQRGGNTYDYGYQSKVTSYIEPQRRVAQSHYGGAATGRKPAANGCGWPALIGGLIAVVGIIGGSVAFFTLGLDGSNAVGQSSPPTLKPTPLPTTLRSAASPYIVVTFTNPPTTPTAAVNAFDAAAARWSSILSGTQVNLGTIDPGDTFNQFDCGLTNNAAIPQTQITQLHIAADIAPIDGVGNVLGSAGPCSGFLESVDKAGTFLPVLGQMTFDVDDLANLISEGTLEDVILHEMGHVLGLGTLWSGSVGLGIPTLVLDEVFPFGQPIQPFNSPRYVGHGAKSEFAVLSGSSGDIPVEDGSFRGFSPSQLASGAGRGSVDGHWRETVFQTELMTPAIGGTSNPMSLMTLRSLEDIGYAVDTSEADSYSIPSSSQASGSPAKREHLTLLEGDIFRCPELKTGLQKAKNRARAMRRLGGRASISLHDG